MTEIHVPEALLKALAEIGEDGAPHPRAEPGRLPRSTGAYLLLLRVSRTTVAIRRKTPETFSPGWYIYAGNAYGPGGIAARVARHFRRGKRRHWHIDSLTDKADLWALAVPGGAECDLIARLKASPDFSVPARGFGSSDCRICESHLLAWKPGAYQPGGMP